MLLWQKYFGVFKFSISIKETAASIESPPLPDKRSSRKSRRILIKMCKERNKQEQEREKITNKRTSPSRYTPSSMDCSRWAQENLQEQTFSRVQKHHDTTFESPPAGHPSET